MAYKLNKVAHLLIGADHLMKIHIEVNFIIETNIILVFNEFDDENSFLCVHLWNLV